VELRQFVGDNDWPVTQHGLDVLEGLAEAVGRFEQHQRPRETAQFSQPAAPLTAPRRREAHERREIRFD
jgi:hypothetical protein